MYYSSVKLGGYNKIRPLRIPVWQQVLAGVFAVLIAFSAGREIVTSRPAAVGQGATPGQVSAPHYPVRALHIDGITAAPAVRAVPLPQGGSKAGEKTVAPPTGFTTQNGHPPVGIAGGSQLAGLPPAELGRRLDGMKALGATWVRFDIDWRNIQPDGPHQGNWRDYDKVVDAARARDLQVLAIIDFTPKWARLGECDHTERCAPADPQDFARFSRTVAARYAPRGVHAYEIWNEPNSVDFFLPAGDAERYTRLVKAAYPAIKAADPKAVVLAGSFALKDTDGENVSPRDFLTRMYGAGARGSFDALSHHPYTFPLPPSIDTARNAWGRTGELHAIMAARGDGAKKIWITEYGAPTGGPGPVATSGNLNLANNPYRVDEALQARTAAEIVRLQRSTPWAGPLFWYSYQDSGTSHDTNENHFGLVRYDGSKKPAYYALQKAIAGP